MGQCIRTPHCQPLQPARFLGPLLRVWENGEMSALPHLSMRLVSGPSCKVVLLC